AQPVDDRRGIGGVQDDLVDRLEIIIDLVRPPLIPRITPQVDMKAAKGLFDRPDTACSPALLDDGNPPRRLAQRPQICKQRLIGRLEKVVPVNDVWANAV